MTDIRAAGISKDFGAVRALDRLSLTVALTGLDPNTFSLNTARFAAFAAGAAVPLVTVLVVGFVVEPSPDLLALLAATGLALGLVGVGLFRWSVPRGTERFRMG